MRIIKFFFMFLLALILIASTAIFIFFQTFDTDQYISKITSKCTFFVGRQVSFGHVGLALSLRGITLDAGPASIADDDNFTSQPFVKIDRISISLDLESLILKRQIQIRSILLDHPQIHFIRNQDGILNIHRIGHHDNQNTDPSLIPTASSSIEPLPIPNSLQGGDQSQKGNAFAGITIRSIVIQNAAISFIDQSESNPLDIWLTDINTSLNDFVFSKERFQLAGLNLQGSIAHNKDVEGQVQFDLTHVLIDPSGISEANGTLNINDGVIRNFNIIKTVLSYALGAFGDVQADIGPDDTIIKKAQIQFSYHDKTVFIDDSLFQTNVFEFKAKGSVDDTFNVDMETMLHLNNDISNVLVGQLDGLKYLCDDSKRIAIGASLKGVIPHLKYKPNKDFKKKSKKVLIEEGASFLGALLGGR